MLPECLRNVCQRKILYGELEMGKRSHGGQKKRCKDSLKATLKFFNIPTEPLEQITQDRAKWRGRMRRGASKYDAEQKGGDRPIRGLW